MIHVLNVYSLFVKNDDVQQSHSVLRVSRCVPQTLHCSTNRAYEISHTHNKVETILCSDAFGDDAWVETHLANWQRRNLPNGLLSAEQRRRGQWNTLVGLAQSAGNCFCVGTRFSCKEKRSGPRAHKWGF